MKNKNANRSLSRLKSEAESAQAALERATAVAREAQAALGAYVRAQGSAPEAIQGPTVMAGAMQAAQAWLAREREHDAVDVGGLEHRPIGS